MNKKILSLVLALVMVLGTFTSVFATETKKEEEVKKVVGKDQKIQYIIDNKFVEGYGDGDYGYDKNIKRSEITKLLVFANGNKALSEKLQGSMKLYSDVETSFWANGVISVGTTVPSTANKLAMLNGYPDGTFKPENDVTYAELAKMLVVLVKTDLTADMLKEANAKWATMWMTWAAELGILDDVTVANSNAPATRADAFVMMYNALYAMKYIKRLPSNETMGILSQLKNTELTLNQGEKAKTFKITPNTTFVLYSNEDGLDVNAANAGYWTNRWSKAVKVASIDNPRYYYGSLVRVLADEKGEVTHILQLGNPKFLALGNNDVSPNKQNLIAGQWDPSFPNNAAAELGKIINKIAEKAATGNVNWEVLKTMKAADEYANQVIKKISYTGQGWWRVDPNTRWADVAKATAETKVFDLSPVQDFARTLNLPEVLAYIKQACPDVNKPCPPTVQEQRGFAPSDVPNDTTNNGKKTTVYEQIERVVKAVYSQEFGDIVNAANCDSDAWNRFLAKVKTEITNVKCLPNAAGLADTVVSVIRNAGLNLRAPNAFGILAKIDYSNGAPNEIGFWGGAFTKPTVNESREADPNNYQSWDYLNVNGWLPAQELLTARLTSKTRYFVADVANNQLTELSSADEAVRLLGNVRASNWFSDVYIGYDKIGGRDAIEHSENYALNTVNEATVVVFNSVQRGNNNGRLLRAKQQSTDLYDVRLEDEDGKISIENLKEYRRGFQFMNARTEFNTNVEIANMDVVKFTTNNAYGIDAVVKIDHSNTDRYPIAKVREVQDSGRTLLLEGEFGETASVLLDTDYAKFIKSDKLVGRYVQFHTTSNNRLIQDVNTNNVVDILSVLPTTHTWEVKGSLRNVLEANQKHQHAGFVSTEDFTLRGSNEWQIIVNTYRNLYNKADNRATKNFAITLTEYAALKQWLTNNGYTTIANRADVRFKVTPGIYKTDEAFDFEVKVNGYWVLVRTLYVAPVETIPATPIEESNLILVSEAGKAAEVEIRAFLNNNKKVTLANHEAVLASYDKVMKQVNALNAPAAKESEKADYKALMGKYKDALDAVSIKAFAIKSAKANVAKDTADLAIAKADVAKAKANLTKAETDLAKAETNPGTVAAIATAKKELADANALPDTDPGKKAAVATATAKLAAAEKPITDAKNNLEVAKDVLFAKEAALKEAEEALKKSEAALKKAIEDGQK